MATKKTASAKKSATTAAKQTKTKVTTVKAVTADTKPKTASSKKSVSGVLQGRSELLGAYIAEFIGTFILAAVAVLSQGQPLTVGFALVAIVLTIGALSGSHVNPLITVAAWVTRKISGVRALGYIAAQLLGALLAFVVVNAYIPTESANTAAAQLGQSVEIFKAAPVPENKEFYLFFAEMLGAGIFGLAVSSAIREKRNRAAQAFTVGFGLLTALVIAGILTNYVGGSSILNPALAFTLSAVQFQAIELWPVLIYIIAPIIGGTIGFFLFDILRGESDGGDDKLVKDEL